MQGTTNHNQRNPKQYKIFTNKKLKQLFKQQRIKTDRAEGAYENDQGRGR